MAHLLIVNADYYQEIAATLEQGATAVLDAGGHTHERIAVPGAFEIPGAIRSAIESARFDGYIALGCVIRGETSHYDYVCGECANGLQHLAVHYHVAIGFGVLTVDAMGQAQTRADIRQGNKGGEAAEACLRMIELKAHFAHAYRPSGTLLTGKTHLEGEHRPVLDDHSGQ